MLDQLQRDGGRRKTIEVAALVGAAALIVAIGWMFLRPANDATVLPGGTVFGGDATAINFDQCGSDPDPCGSLQAGRYLVPLETPFSASVPDGWTASGDSTAVGRVAYVAQFLNDQDGAHVGFQMNPRKYQAGADGNYGISTTPSTAQELARWVASQPYLVATEAVSTTVGGLPAWQVDVQMMDGVMHGWGQYDRGPGFNASTCPHTCKAIIGYPDTNDIVGLGLGIQDGPFRWIFVQAPHGKVVTITIDTGRSGFDFGALLEKTQPIIDGLVFDATS